MCRHTYIIQTYVGVCVFFNYTVDETLTNKKSNCQGHRDKHGRAGSELIRLAFHGFELESYSVGAPE